MQIIELGEYARSALRIEEECVRLIDVTLADLDSRAGLCTSVLR